MKTLILLQFILSLAIANTNPELTLESYTYLNSEEKNNLFTDYNENFERIKWSKYKDTITELEKLAIMKNVESIGDELAYIWDDTILEGPYSLDGQIKIVIVEVFVKEGQFFGAKAYVTNPAILVDFDDSECSYRRSTDRYEGELCDNYRGEITEWYVVDHFGNLMDTDSYAEFESH